MTPPASVSTPTSSRPRFFVLGFRPVASITWSASMAEPASVISLWVGLARDLDGRGG